MGGSKTLEASKTVHSARCTDAFQNTYLSLARISDGASARARIARTSSAFDKGASRVGAAAVSELARTEIRIALIMIITQVARKSLSGLLFGGECSSMFELGGYCAPYSVPLFTLS